MLANPYEWRIRDKGSGPAILLLHAFPYDGRMWDGQADVLAASHRVLVPDMPGFGGAAAWPATPPHVDAWAADLLSGLGRLGVTKAIVAGCSLGGYLAFALMRAAPDFLQGLALVDSRSIPDSKDRRTARLEDAERIIREGRSFFIERTRRPLDEELSAYPAARASAEKMLADASSGGLADALVALATRPDSTPQLASIKVPAVVMRGVNDPILGRDEAVGLAAAVAGAVYVEFEGAGHIPTFQRPDQVTAALLALAARCGS
ncbi:MAG TPA: alpha/beta hydrolase [Candidatus Eremiobacteraceae bacterium]|nr:alpha/beta hydrolase [Candidatus Eremiobacteraceae bacterium]